MVSIWIKTQPPRYRRRFWRPRPLLPFPVCLVRDLFPERRGVDDETGPVPRVSRRSTDPTNASAASGNSQCPTKASAVPARVASRPGARGATRGPDTEAGITLSSITCPSMISLSPAGTSSDDLARRIAPVGHTSRQTRHSLHSDGLIVTTPSIPSRMIAPLGQASTHAAQPLHLVRSMYSKMMLKKSYRRRLKKRRPRPPRRPPHLRDAPRPSRALRPRRTGTPARPA